MFWRKRKSSRRSPEQADYEFDYFRCPFGDERDQCAEEDKEDVVHHPPLSLKPFFLGLLGSILYYLLRAIFEMLKS